MSEKEKHTIYEGVVFGVDAMAQYKPKIYEGFIKPYGLREEVYWNGWLIPYVKKNVRDQILKDLDVENTEIWDDENIEDFKQYAKEKPNKIIYIVSDGVFAGINTIGRGNQSMLLRCLCLIVCG